MYQFFLPNETELKKIIRESLQDQDTVLDVQTIQTGWTNITMDVQGEQHDYIFRFPRNHFFANMIVKDCLFCSFVKGKTRIPTPDMKLLFHQERPFSLHVKIKGCALDKRMTGLTPDECELVADDLSGFLVDLHSISPQQMPTEIRESLNDFLTGLATVHKGDYNIEMHNQLIKMEQNPSRQCIVHGDFHPGNVLVNDQNRVCGVIDFAFASISDYHADLGRFVGRSTPQLGSAVVRAYQQKMKHPCLNNRIQSIVDLFKYVEFKYVQYMQSSHPEIIIPTSVLQMAEQYSLAHTRTV